MCTKGVEALLSAILIIMLYLYFIPFVMCNLRNTILGALVIVLNEFRYFSVK